MFKFDIFDFLTWSIMSFGVFILSRLLGKFASVVFFESFLELFSEFFVLYTVLNAVASEDDETTLRCIDRLDFRESYD